MLAADGKNFLIEVIVCTVNDAEQAESGGADRLEVVQELAQGGLSPKLELVEEILQRVSISVRVMIRPRNCFFGFRLSEIEQMRAQVTRLSASGVEGVVVGILNEKGDIDFRALEKILANKNTLKVTFHRAFDYVKDPRKSLLDIIRFGGIDRILTSGEFSGAKDRFEGLATLNTLAAGQITIIAGGGLRRNNIVQIAQKTGIHEFHFGRAVRAPATVDGIVCAQKVRNIKETLQKAFWSNPYE